MKLAVASETSSPEEAPPSAMEDELARLARENARLRRAVSRLRVYRSMAYRDPLTGLWNRRFFESRLKEEFSRSRRAGAGRRFSVMIIDVNWFKEINDVHGHQAGDSALKWVGEFLVTHLRTHDVPCRTGGDEFMVLLPDLSGDDCRQVIGRLREHLARANASLVIPLSLSIGAASWPEVSESQAKILAVADAAMYEDKRFQRAGRGDVSTRSGVREFGASA